MRLTTRARSRPRLALALLACAALAASAGCVAPTDVRAVLLVESYAFAEGAPAEAAREMAFTGCTGDYDPATRQVTLAAPMTFHPKFVLILHRAADSQGPGGVPDPMAGRYLPLSSGSSGEGLLPRIDAMMGERMGSGSWGYHGHFGGRETSISYDGRGPTIDGERLTLGERIDGVDSYEGANSDGTFQVTRTTSVEYLGRVPYRIQPAC